jgi:integrase
MTFRVIYRQPAANAQSPVRVVEQPSGREIGWINRFLDREYVRRVAERTLRIDAYNLLHFVRWWESLYHTGDVAESALTESTLLDYVRFQSSQQPRPAGSTINDRVALADRALRNEFPDAPCQSARGFHQPFLRRRPMGLGRPRVAMSRLRVKTPQRTSVPLSVDEVARFWSSFRLARDLAIVGLMLMQGLRSAEVLALNRDDLLLSEGQLRVRGKGNKLRFLPLAPESIQLSNTISDWNGPTPVPRAVRLVERPRTRPTHDTRGMRSLFRYHRQIPVSRSPTRIAFDTRSPRHGAGCISLPPDATHGSRRHSDHAAICAIHPQDVYVEYTRAVAQHIRPVPAVPS